MAVSGVARPNFDAINRVLAEIGKSIDAGTERGVAVSEGEAQKIVNHLGTLAPADRKLVEAEIIALLQSDVFQASPEGRKKFAEHFGLTARDLEPRETAQLVGLASSRSAFQLGVETLAKTPRLDRKNMKVLLSRADTLLDMPNKQFLAGVLRNASRDGTVQLDTDARKLFRQWMGGLDQQGGVSDWTSSFDSKGTGNIDYLSKLIASGACFEDILAAFMIHIAGQMQQEQVEKLKEIQRAETDAAKPQPSVKKSMNDFMQQNGLAPEGAAAATDTKQAPAAAAAPDADYMKSTKRNLEAVVQSVHHHMNDDDKFINADEAGKIAEKLGRLEEPVSKLIAGSLVNALRRSPGVDLSSDTFKPIVDWAKTQLGADIDVSALAPQKASDPTDPFAQKLRQSDKLEDKIASFMVDSLLASDKDLSAKMGDLKQLSASMENYPEAAKAYEQVTAQQSTAQQSTAQQSAAQQSTVPGETAEKMLAQPEAQAPAQAQAVPGANGEAAKLSQAAAADPTAATAQGAAVAGEAAAAGVEGEPKKSRQVLFEELKNQNNELAAVMQALSNILNSMHQNAMNSIRSIR